MSTATLCTVEIEVSWLGLVATLECECRITGVEPATYDEPPYPGDFDLVSVSLVRLGDAGLEVFPRLRLNVHLVDDLYGDQIQRAVNQAELNEEVLPWDREPDASERFDDEPFLEGSHA
ncbi:MAG: hypothetical protein Q8N51_00690 [Gammaproteobacteria bacterium]|nr:hypothetical protein [Gammaproteobacteria bacterium]